MQRVSRLIRRDRTADLAADPLQLVGVILPELLDRDFRTADLGHRIGAEAAENIADAPDREADDQAAHDDAHDGLADPGRGGFVNTAKHACLVLAGGDVRMKGWSRPYRERAKCLQLKKDRR